MAGPPRTTPTARARTIGLTVPDQLDEPHSIAAVSVAGPRPRDDAA